MKRTKKSKFPPTVFPLTEVGKAVWKRLIPLNKKRAIIISRLNEIDEEIARITADLEAEADKLILADWRAQQ